MKKPNLRERARAGAIGRVGKSVTWAHWRHGYTVGWLAGYRAARRKRK